MKFFFKLFLSMVMILTAALSAVSFFTVSSSMKYAFEREYNSALAQHQMVKYSMRASMLSTDDALLASSLTPIAEAAADLIGSEGQLALTGENGRIYFSTLYDTGGGAAESTGEVENGAIDYYVVTDLRGERQLTAESRFSHNGENFVLTTQRNISRIFDEAEKLQKNCMRLYLVILGVSTVVMFLLSWALTRPVAELRSSSRRFAQGDYSSRAIVKSKDEMGEFAQAYNSMADTIEGKIHELEDAARRQEDFTANLAHELKTPMTSIIGYADTIYQKNLPPEQVKQAAWYIMNEGMRLEALSFKLLELLTAGKDGFALEQAMMGEVLCDAAQAASAAAEKRKISLTCRCDSGWARIEYDLFKTLLLNLLDNAMKSGATRVLLQGEMLEERYRITVTDNGRGIPAEELKRISEPFYMVDKSRSRREHGAGLGLALADRIAAIHGTKLHYKSEVGVGTQVELSLKAEVDDIES